MFERSSDEGTPHVGCPRLSRQSGTIVQIEIGSFFRPDVEAAENPKIAYEGGRLNPVPPVADRPSRPDPNGEDQVAESTKHGERSPFSRTTRNTVNGR